MNLLQPYPKDGVPAYRCDGWLGLKSWRSCKKSEFNFDALLHIEFKNCEINLCALFCGYIKVDGVDRLIKWPTGFIGHLTVYGLLFPGFFARAGG